MNYSVYLSALSAEGEHKLFFNRSIDVINAYAFLQQYFDDDINQNSRISMSHVHKDEESVLPSGKRVEVVIAMPFLDVNPLAANQ